MPLQHNIFLRDCKSIASPLLSKIVQETAASCHNRNYFTSWCVHSLIKLVLCNNIIVPYFSPLWCSEWYLCGHLSHTSSSVTIKWGSVPCVDRNGDIHGYYVSYYPTLYPTKDITGSDKEFFKASRLMPRTNYTFQVSAIHIENSASNPTFLFGPSATITTETLANEDL